MNARQERSFDCDEMLLCEAMGIGRTVAVQTRNDTMPSGQEWAIVGHRVMLTKKGAVELLKRLGFTLPDSDMKAMLVRCRPGPAPQEKGRILVRVLRPWTNPAMLMGFNLSAPDSRMVDVKVGKNTNFRPGMELVAEHLDGDPEDVFTLVGPAPRAYGRW